MNKPKTINDCILLVASKTYENLIKKDLSNEQIEKVIEIIKILAN